jgi:protein involved in ribonucleotide reduction
MIAFASRTGNVRYVVSKLGLPAFDIEDRQLISEPFLLFTYTDGLGEIPAKVRQFMEQNGSLCRGVIVSGNSNFGTTFGKAGEVIAAQWSIPLVRKLELRGFGDDYEAIRRYYEQNVRKELSA